MLHYLVNVINTLFFTLVLLGVLLGALSDGEKIRAKSVVVASALGFLTALIIAILYANTRWINREYYNLIILIPLIIAQLIFAFFLFFAPRFRSSAAIVRFFIPLILFLLLAYGLVDIFLYPSEFSVGMDNIYNEEFALKWFGYALALATLLILYYSVYQAALSSSKKIFLSLGGAILLLVVIHEALSVIYALYPRGVIPRWLIDAVFLISEHLSWLFYAACAATVSVAATLYAVENRKIFVVSQNGGTNRDLLYAANKLNVISAPNPAIRRKLFAQSKSKRRFYVLTTLSLFAAALFAKGGSYLAEREVEISPAVSVSAENGVIVFALEEFDDGRLKRYAYKSANGTEIRFIIIKKDRGGYGVGLDACEICGVSGYYEEKGKVICSRCGVAINKATIGFRGGCNPIPFPYEVTNSTLRIYVKALEDEEDRFR
ncbi:MAG: Fe-S-containing protein [Helicobacteraceae bacterium]|jgi:uncharacterized membrane protein|nr:Fe-S-containing protein [Helicobacteraceae bacterium]